MANSGIQAILGNDFIPSQVRGWQKGKNVILAHEWWAQTSRERANSQERIPRDFATLCKLCPGEKYKHWDGLRTYSGVVKIDSAGYAKFKFTCGEDPYSEEWLMPHVAARLVEEKEKSSRV